MNNSGENRMKKKKSRKKREQQREMALEFIKSKRGSTVFGWVFQVAVVLGIAAVVSIFFFQSICMQESSMEPTLQTGETFFVDKLAYKLKGPRRGDMIAFTKNGKDHAAIHIKRVIGLPGEMIQIQDGDVYIDGKKYKEKIKVDKMINPGLAGKGVTLKSDEYFVLGDNRNNSEDSRFAEVKKVKKKYIEGKLWFRISPVSEIGFVKH